MRNRPRLPRFCRLVPKLILVLVAASAIAQNVPRASTGMEHDFEEAMAAEDRGDLARAESLLAHLHAATQGNFAVDESLGLLYIRREQVDRALPLLQAAVHDQPTSDAAHANLGAALYQVHRNPEAIVEFMHAVKINPANESALESLGRVEMDQHKPDDAARALHEALRLKPEDTDLQLDCATALLAANELTRAREILAAFPDAGHSARAQSLLGEADEQEKNFISAGTHFNQAVSIEPSEENAWQMGEEFLRHWTFGAAALEFEAAAVKFPDSQRMRVGLGAALFGNAKYLRAIPVFADLLDSEPDNATYAAMLGVSCTTLVSEDRPRCASLVRYAEAHPRDAKAASYAAAFLVKQSDSEQQMPLIHSLLEAALAADPKLSEAQFQMGVFLQDDGEWKESIPYLERAVDIKPEFTRAHYRLSLACWRSNRKQEAAKEMELEKKYSQKGEDDLNGRMREIESFVVFVQK
jgi:tetratricopeptide (TPR) repeat protein